jgi:heme exporter protein A
VNELVVKAEGLSRRYGERLALDDVSFTLAAGQTLAVFGANGAGKTTLLRVLATLLRPHGGETTVFGRALPRDAWAVRGRIGVVGHDPLIYRDLTARENLTFIARLYGVPLARVEDSLKLVKLDRRADEAVKNFSKGMLQRLAAARALLPEPELLLLDEPRANLDPGAAELLEPLLGKDGQRARVIVTHDVDYGLSEADVVLGLKRGKQEWFEPKASVDAARVKELYR